MTYEEFEAALQVFLFDEWLRRVGWEKDVVRGFFEHGIPVEYAKLIAETLGPKFPVSIWPKLLHPPKAVSTTINGSRSMFSSKMEIENARASKRVKIAASMTSDSNAKRALLEANITPKDVAALLGVGHSTVNAWCTGARSIPRCYVNRLREKHRIPANVWPKIAG